MQNDLADELERLIEAFHDGLPDGQGETGDGGVAGRALCQFVYDQADDIAKALRCPVPADVADLVERLNALHVWPQFVADTHADVLLPRQIAGLYAVGSVATEAAALLTTLASGRDEWLPIETFVEPTAMSSGDGVLVALSDGTVGEAYFRNYGDESDGWWWANTSWGDYPEPDRLNPTHWRPLPTPPQGDQQ